MGHGAGHGLGHATGAGHGAGHALGHATGAGHGAGTGLTTGEWASTVGGAVGRFVGAVMSGARVSRGSGATLMSLGGRSLKSGGAAKSSAPRSSSAAATAAVQVFVMLGLLVLIRGMSEPSPPAPCGATSGFVRNRNRQRANDVSSAKRETQVRCESKFRKASPECAVCRSDIPV